jgi:hypothetical protein
VTSIATTRTSRWPPQSAWMLLVFVMGVSVSLAQYSYLEEPQAPLSLPQFKYFKFDIEAEQAHQNSAGAAVQTRTERLYLSPALGITWDHYIYHPDLVNFSILAEPGYVWQKSGPSGALEEENHFLLNGNLNATLLQLKPYATTVYANAGHNTHQYDFFNTVTEDSHGWGVISGYRQGPVPFTVSVQQTTRDSSGFSYDYTSDETVLNLHAQNERKLQNITDFSYQYSQYQSTTSGSGENFADSSTFHYLTLTDAEHFRKSTLNSTVIFQETDANGLSSDDLNASLAYNIEHTPNFHSVYDYAFSWFSTDAGDSLQHYARAGVQHQLYESLSSAADLHGSTVNSSFSGSTLDLATVGTTASLNYSKRLSSWARLSIGNSVNFDLTDQTSSGAALLIPNESHNLVSGQWVRLNQPRVITIIIVTADAAHGNQPLTENVDYYVDRTRDPWQIQISPFSVIIHSGDNVLVTYTVQPNPSGSYTTLSDQAQIRLDLWNGRLGLYGRYLFTENHTSTAGFVLEDIEELQAGVDFSWRGLRLDGNYTDRDSSLYDYTYYTLTESYSKRLGSQSTFSLDLHQRWNLYPGSGSTNNPSYEVTYYDYLLRYDWHPVSSLDWSAEAGYEQQRGHALDQDLFAVRTYLSWTAGKLDVHVGYEFQDQKYIEHSRDRHFVFVRLKRNF